MSQVIILSDNNFQQEVMHTTGVVLVDFWAPWCGPCKTIGPVVDEIAEQKTHIKVGKLNVDENPLTTGQFAVMSIPTLILFKEGQQKEKMIGAHSKEEIESLIEKVLHG